MRRNRSETPLFPKSEASEIERLASQEHPQLMSHAQARLEQYRQHYEARYDSVADTVIGSSRRFSRSLVLAGSISAGLAAVLELSPAESPNGEGPMVVAAGIGIAVVGLAWRRVIPNEQHLPPSPQVAAIEGYLTQLSQRQLPSDGEVV